MNPAPGPTEAAPEAGAEEMPQPERNRDGMPHWALFLVALPMLYVLSTGPAALIVKKTGLPAEHFRTFYAPLAWLHKHTALRHPLDWYVKLWT